MVDISRINDQIEALVQFRKRRSHLWFLHDMPINLHTVFIVYTYTFTYLPEMYIGRGEARIYCLGAIAQVMVSL